MAAPSWLRRLRVRAATVTPIRRRSQSAPSVDHLLADIRRMLMDPSADAQAITTQVNALPAAIQAEVAAEVTAAESAKDAQHAADLAAIGAAVTAVSSGVSKPAT